MPDILTLSTLLPPVLAQATATAAQHLTGGPANPWADLAFWRVLSGLAMVAGIILTLLLIREKLRIKPAIHELATKAELAALAKSLGEQGAAREDKIIAALDALRARMDTQSHNIHARISSVEEKRSASMEALQRALGRLEAPAKTARS